LGLPLLLLPALEYLLLTPHLFFERAPLVFMLPGGVCRLCRARRLRSFYPLPILQRLALARLLCFEPALFALLAAAYLLGCRIWSLPRGFNPARRTVCGPSFNRRTIEDYVVASDFTAATGRTTVRNAVARDGTARGLFDAFDVDAAVDDAVFNCGVIGDIFC
jgi:hypothetical protein